MKKKLFLLFLMAMMTRSFAQFTEGFENGIPSTWTIINGGEPTTWNHITMTVPNTEPFWIHSGTGAAGINVLWGTQDDYLITPAITVIAGVNDRMSFWCSRFDTEADEGMEVMISTTTPTVEGMNPIDNINPEAGGFYNPNHKKYYYDLSGYIGQTIYIGFRATHTQPWKLFIDDFTNDAKPTTLPGCGLITYPENGATHVDHVGLLKWNEVPGIEGYAITLGTSPNGAEVFNALDVGDVTSKAVGPLELETTYYVKIVPYNNIGSAAGCIEYSFKTRNEIMGDICAKAIDLSTLPSPFTSTTTGAADDDFGCYLWTGPDIFYKIEVPDGATLTIRQTHNSYQSANTVFYGQCTDRTEIYCGVATDIYSPIIWKNTTGSSQMVYWIQYGAGWNEDQNDGEFTIEWSLASCEFPIATFNTVSNCDTTSGFFVNVDVTDMGTAATVNITDNQGSPMQTADEAGAVQFGPYTIGTPVTFTVVNAEESSCFINSNPITLAICPPDCSDAAVIVVEQEVPCVIESGAGAWAFDWATAGKEKLYSFTPTITGKYGVQTVWDGEDMNELPINAISLFYKAADADCASGWNYLSTSDFFSSFISSDDLVAGTEYLLLFDAMETTGSYNRFKIVYFEACDNAVVTHTITSECEEGAEYYLDIHIESLGTATSHNLWVSTIDGPMFYGEITETGTINLGPFPYASQVSYSLTNDQTQLCTSVNSGRITQLNACPNFYPACAVLTYPVNGATEVPLSDTNSQAGLTITWEAPAESIPPIGYSIYFGLTPTSLSYIGFTTTELSMSLIGFTNNTTYYWKVVPWNIFEQFLVGGTPISCEVYSFTTGEFTPHGYCLNGPQGLSGAFSPLCNGTSETVVDFAYAGYYEYVNVVAGTTYTFASTGTNPSGAPDLITIGSEDGLTPLAWSNSPLTWTADVSGLVRFYIHLSELCGGDELGRIKSVSCAELSTEAFNISELKAYPNPTKDFLKVSYINGIEDVTVFNVLGQKVLSQKVNGTEARLDMQALSGGTYLVRIRSAANETKTVKIIKE